MAAYRTCSLKGIDPDARVGLPTNSPQMQRKRPKMEIPESVPSQTANATPENSTSNAKNSSRVGGLFSMKTDPTAHTTGIDALHTNICLAYRLQLVEAVNSLHA